MQKLKSIISCLLVAATTTVCAQSFTIEGDVELNEGVLLVLTQRLEGIDTLARAEIDNQRFTITGAVDAPVVALLKVDGYEGGFIMILEPEEKYIAVLTQQGDGSIHGGEIQEDFLKYQKIVNEANSGMRRVKEEIAEANQQRHFKTAKELQDKLQEIQDDAYAQIDLIIEKNADNVLAAYLKIIGIESAAQPELLKRVYDSMSAGARATEPGKILAAQIASMEQVSILAIAPNFTLTDPNGEEVSLYDIKGKLKILDFWASWCGPCRMENPNMVKLYSDFKDKGLEIISVSLDENKKSWITAIEKDGMPWIHLSSLKGWRCDVVKQYNVDGVPFILVLDENNRIIAKNIRAEKLRTFVEERL